MEKENQELIAIFQKHGIRVWRPEVLTQEQLVINLGEDAIRYCGVVLQYSRDPIVVIGDNLIELNLATFTRIADLIAYRQLFMDRVLGSNAKWFDMPKLDYSKMFESGRGSDTENTIRRKGEVEREAGCES